MSRVSQKVAVQNTIIAVLQERGVTYEFGGKTPISSVLTDADKTKIRESLFAQFRRNEISLSDEAASKFSSDSEMKKYISGLLNNWVRKSKDFNCGQTYQTKNPGSRAGSGDSQIREMKKLLGSTQNAEHKALIQAELDKRIAAVSSAKSKNTVDASKLPENLRHLVKSE